MSNKARKMLCLAGMAVLVGTLAFAGDSDREKYQEKFSRTENLAAGGRVYLSNLSGDIEVAVWKENQVKIEAVKVSRAGTADRARENAAKVTIEVRTEGGDLVIETKYPNNSGGFWSGDNINVSVDYKLLIPEKAALEVKSVSGDVRLAGLGGQTKVKSISGNLKVKGAAGLQANLVSGDVELEDINGDIEAKTVSGNLAVHRSKGSVEASSVSGDVEIRDNAEARFVTAKSISGGIRYDGVIYDNGRYEFSSQSGDVRILVPAGSNFDLESKTFSGDIESDFDIRVVGKISTHEIRGTVGKGGADVRANSFSGNVELRKK